MKYVLSASEMQECDAYTIKNITPSIELTENAGKAIFKVIYKKYKDLKNVLIVAGGGGNGGDALVVARYLLNKGIKTYLYLASTHLKEETKTNLSLYKGEKIEFDELNKIKFDLVVDGLLGIGINTPLNEKYLNLINKINSLNLKTVSIDINSGIDATSGKSLGAFIKSELTVAVEAYKYGHFFNEGIDAYKELKLISAKVNILKNNAFLKALEEKDFKFAFKKRDRNSNKGDNGRVALIGGSKLTPGAIMLSLNALISLRLGSGYSRVCIPESLYNLYALKNSENIYFLFKDNDGEIIFNEDDLNKVMKYNAISIGMGIGTSLEVYKIVSYLLKNYGGNLVLDADALNSISKYGIDILKDHKPKNVILTPHIKEFSRLVNEDIESIKLNRIELAKNFTSTYDVILILKDDVTLINHKEESYLNINGNAGLAKGGSGDLLSGIALGLFKSDDEPVKRAALASYLLGKSADLAIKDINEYSLISSDVSHYIIKAINSIIKVK